MADVNRADTADNIVTAKTPEPNEKIMAELAQLQALTSTYNFQPTKYDTTDLNDLMLTIKKLNETLKIDDQINGIIKNLTDAFKVQSASHLAQKAECTRVLTGLINDNLSLDGVRLIYGNAEPAAAPVRTNKTIQREHAPPVSAAGVVSESWASKLAPTNKRAPKKEAGVSVDRNLDAPGLIGLAPGYRFATCPDSSGTFSIPINNEHFYLIMPEGRFTKSGLAVVEYWHNSKKTNCLHLAYRIYDPNGAPLITIILAHGWIEFVETSTIATSIYNPEVANKSRHPPDPSYFYTYPHNWEYDNNGNPIGRQNHRHLPPCLSMTSRCRYGPNSDKMIRRMPGKDDHHEREIYCDTTQLPYGDSHDPVAQMKSAANDDTAKMNFAFWMCAMQFTAWIMYAVEHGVNAVELD